MPHIQITGMDINSVQALSKEFSGSLATTIGCPVDWITFSAQRPMQVPLISNNVILTESVRIYVEWFDRGQQIKDAVAKLLTEHILNSQPSQQSPITEVTIIFVTLLPTDYYENGQHC